MDLLAFLFAVIAAVLFTIEALAATTVARPRLIALGLALLTVALICQFATVSSSTVG